MASIAACAGAQGTPPNVPSGAQDVPKITKQDAKRVLEEKEVEIRALSAHARDVSKKIGELAIKGEVATNKDAVEELKKLVSELQQVNERLEKIEQDISGIKGWIEGQSESLPIMLEDILNLKKVKDSNYVQFQFRDSNEAGRQQHSWNIRRARVGFGFQIDPKTSTKLSFDVATGSNQLGSELKDAILSYAIAPSTSVQGTDLHAGQFSLPLGYEIARSSSEREFPERSRYNTTMFNGERVRGAFIEHGVGGNASISAGLINSLAIKDAESNHTAGVGGRQSAFIGARIETNQLSTGISYLAGKRPMFTGGGGTSPEIDRHFLYADFSYVGILDPNLYIRSEAMWGKDRLPNATGAPGRTAKDLNGYHVLLGYNLNPRNQIFTKYGTFDPDTDATGNFLKEYGVGYRYYFNPGAMVTFTWEVTEDPARTPNRWNLATLRYQFKF